MSFAVACKTAGILIILATLIDIYLTVLYPRSGAGLLSKSLLRGTWSVLSTIAQGVHHDRWLVHSGPLMVLLTLTFWGVSVLLGFALYAWPELGTGIIDDSGKPTPTTFAAAVYYAGYSITTLGTGDLVPTRDGLRVMMVVQAALGFSFITLALTYVMSVYGALQHRTSFAADMHHRTADTGEPVQYLKRLFNHAEQSVVEAELGNIATSMARYYESHHFYPVLHYYRFDTAHYAMSRVLFLAMDIRTLIQTALDPEKFPWLQGSVGLEALRCSVLRMIEDLADEFLPSSAMLDETNGDEQTLWREHFFGVLDELEQSNVPCRTDRDAAYLEYQAERAEWNTTVRGFCEYMGYDWDDINR